jgi:hypothetical protein
MAAFEISQAIKSDIFKSHMVVYHINEIKGKKNPLFLLQVFDKYCK